MDNGQIITSMITINLIYKLIFVKTDNTTLPIFSRTIPQNLFQVIKGNIINMVFILNSEKLDLSRNVYSKHKGWDLNWTGD